MRRVTINGKRYKSITAAAKTLGIKIQTLRFRVRSKCSKALLGFQGDLTRIKSTDHKGNVYKSISEMARAYGIPRNTLSERINRGWDIEKALTAPLKKGNQNIVSYDHLENEFKSLSDMVEFYGLSREMFWYRLKIKKMSLEETLTTPIRKYKR